MNDGVASARALLLLRLRGIGVPVEAAPFRNAIDELIDAVHAGAIDAMRACPTIDENGYICEKSAAIQAIRALNTKS